MFDASFAETRFLHPTHAVRVRVIEPAWSLDEHIQTHEQTENVLGPVIINDAFVDNESPSRGNCLVLFANEQLLFLQIPVVKDDLLRDYRGWDSEWKL